VKLGRCVNTFQRHLLPPFSEEKKSSTLKTEAAVCFEILVPIHQTTRHHDIEDCTLNIHSYKNLRCQLYLNTLLVVFIVTLTILVILVLLLSRSGNTLRGVLLCLELLDVEADPSLCPLTSGVQRFITLHDVCCRKTQTL
jgi:hypothetical protein